jgi:hypothetical protein
VASISSSSTRAREQGADEPVLALEQKQQYAGARAHGAGQRSEREVAPAMSEDREERHHSFGVDLIGQTYSLVLPVSSGRRPSG